MAELDCQRGGIGSCPFYHHRFPFWLDTTRLPPFDAGNAKAKVDIAAGDRIELSTGMVVSYALVQDSSLGAWAISWQDLEGTNREALRLLKDAGRLVLQYQGDDTSWKRVDRFTSFDDVAILPLSGNAGTIRRVGNEEDGDDGTSYNCRLVIQPTMIEDTLGVTLEWIATQDIAIGEMITVNLPSGGSKRARRLLEKEQKLTGQINYFSVDERAAPNKASKDEL